MITLSLDDKIEALTEQIAAAKGNAQNVEALEQQRADLLIKRYPAYRDHNIGNKPTLKTQKYTEFVGCLDIPGLMTEAIESRKVFALTKDKVTHCFFIGAERAVTVKITAGSRGNAYNMFEVSTGEARQQYKDLMGQRYQRNGDEMAIAVVCRKET
jgi:hypothetical protein